MRKIFFYDNGFILCLLKTIAGLNYFSFFVMDWAAGYSFCVTSFVVMSTGFSPLSPLQYPVAQLTGFIDCRVATSRLYITELAY